MKRSGQLLLNPSVAQGWGLHEPSKAARIMTIMDDFGDWLELRIDAAIVYLDWTLDGTQADDFEERELSPMFSLCAMKSW